MPASPDNLQHTSWQDQAGPSRQQHATSPKRRPDVSSRLIDGETVVLDRQAGLIHQLNHTASYVWEHCDGKSTVTEIARQLAQAFDVDLTVATQDVRSMVRQLQELHLLELG